jgi:hypothetical protein
MNTEKVQNLINEVIETNRARIGGKAARKQYAPAKHQIVTLTELGILDLMPKGFGHSDASVVIAEAQRGESSVMDANYEGTGIASSNLYDALNEIEMATKFFITFPIDMLWQDADADDYNADATEQAYADAVTRALYAEGYEAEISWSNVSSTRIEREDGDDVGDDYDFIRTVMDTVEVDYIVMES